MRQHAAAYQNAKAVGVDCKPLPAVFRNFSGADNLAKLSANGTALELLLILSTFCAALLQRRVKPANGRPFRINRD
jgi:hypothetical protein